jgi:hypothetical protein
MIKYIRIFHKIKNCTIYNDKSDRTLELQAANFVDKQKGQCKTKIYKTKVLK